MLIKAIETNYKGYRFRSRLEARWAVFFDDLGLTWEYEKEGYDLGEAGWYLPDFWLPDIDHGYWVEVKGENPGSGSKALEKLALVSEHTGCAGLLVYGEPYANVLHGRDETCVDWWMVDGEEGGDGPYLFCVCPWCGKVGLEFDGRGARVCGWNKHHETEQQALDAIKHLGHWRADDKCYTADAPKIEHAASMARAARF